MVKICVAGCVHGAMEMMYNDIKETERMYDIKIDIVLCCGDFQSLRNNSDIAIMSAPPKYRLIGDFWKYYSGESKAPYLTIFIGGNHEASNFLQELPYGGWVSPNIYYMGYAGVVNFRGLRIAGMSGIYEESDFYMGHYEHPPYNTKSIHTAYHLREIERLRLTQIKSPVDIVLSHDWPRGIQFYSNNLEELLRQKDFYAEQIQENDWGNFPAEEILMHIKPRYWFAAHHHVKFAASVAFKEPANRVTRFLALDKSIPNHPYLQILDIEPEVVVPDTDSHIYLDPEWLCILRATNHLMSLSTMIDWLPSTENDQTKFDFTVSKEDLENMSRLFENQFQVKDTFELTAPIYDGAYFNPWRPSFCDQIYTNPQTDYLCTKLGLVNPNRVFLDDKQQFDDLCKKGSQCSLWGKGSKSQGKGFCSQVLGKSMKIVSE